MHFHAQTFLMKISALGEDDLFTACAQLFFIIFGDGVTGH